MQVKSHAKLNLTLKIGQKLKNKLHKIESVMQPIELHDTIKFDKRHDDHIVIESNNENIKNKDNLCVKAAELLKKEYNVNHGMTITIQKSVPLGAGMGGGSSNAAATLVALNSLWKLRISAKKLEQHAYEIGSDVPFFISGKPALVEGTGDIIKPIAKYPKINAVIVNPGFQVSTDWAYKTFDRNKAKLKKIKHINTKDYLKIFQKKDVTAIAKNMFNDFTEVVAKKHSEVKEIRTLMSKYGALSSSLSGSGPTVFGLFNSIYTAREAYFKLKDIYPFVYLTKTI